MFKVIIISTIFFGLALSTLAVSATPDNVKNSTKKISSVIDDKTPSLTNQPSTKKIVAKNTVTKSKALKYMSVNINTASAIELSLGLKNIGKTKAKAIVDYRTNNGAFKKLDELLKIKGIGKKTLEQNNQRIRLEGKNVI